MPASAAPAPAPASTRRSSPTSPTSSPGSATSSVSATSSAARRRRGGPQRGADLRYDLEISFEESATGTETAIQIPREETCETCKGSGAAPGHVAGNLRAVRARPAALSAGLPDRRAPVPELPRHRQDDRQAVPDVPRRRTRRPRAQAHGQDSRRHRHRPAAAALRRRRARQRPAVRPAILYVVVHVQEHAFFHREGDDLYCEMPIAFPTLALGGTIKVPTLDGERGAARCPAGTQPGARFKLRGKGMPNVDGRGHGDLHVIARVAVPKKLTKEQKQLLEELAQDAAARRSCRRTSGRGARSRSSSASKTSLARYPALDLTLDRVSAPPDLA